MDKRESIKISKNFHEWVKFKHRGNDKTFEGTLKRLLNLPTGKIQIENED